MPSCVRTTSFHPEDWHLTSSALYLKKYHDAKAFSWPNPLWTKGVAMLFVLREEVMLDFRHYKMLFAIIILINSMIQLCDVPLGFWVSPVLGSLKSF